MGEGKTILLVQEDLPARKLLCEALHEQGYGVLEAHSGSDAAKVSETHTGPIDLLLADCKVPGMSGMDLADRLRHTRPDLAVVLLSDSTEESALSHIRGLPFVQKPFAPSAVAETIERTLGQNGKGSHMNGAG